MRTIRDHAIGDTLTIAGKRYELIMLNECRARIRAVDVVLDSFRTAEGKEVVIGRRAVRDVAPGTELED